MTVPIETAAAFEAPLVFIPQSDTGLGVRSGENSATDADVAAGSRDTAGIGEGAVAPDHDSTVPDQMVSALFDRPTTPPSDLTACAEAQYGDWIVTRIRDGSCAGYVTEGSETAFGLVCRWVGERRHAMHAFAVLPPFAELNEQEPIDSLEVRYWVLPIAQFASAWRDWEIARVPPPWIEPERGLLTGGLDSDAADEATGRISEDLEELEESGVAGTASELFGELEAADAAEVVRRLLGGLGEDDDARLIVEQPSGLDEGDDAGALPARPSGGPHPARVAFAPGAHLERLIDGQNPILALFGDTNAVRYGRPYELWLEARITAIRDDEEELLEPQRAIFTLTGASEAVSIVTDDCLRLNREATFDSESSSHLLDGFAVDPPTP